MPEAEMLEEGIGLVSRFDLVGCHYLKSGHIL